LPYAASLSVNPCTAFRLLRDFERLQPGDVVLQNGANSMVGLAVIQMAREMGLKTVNIVRSDRPDVGEVLRLLTNLGGDINVPDWYFHSSACQDVLRELPPPKLALNSIGGSSATDLCRAMAPNSTIVTYGGMSKQPFSVPFEMLSEKQLTLKGFWISHWCATHSVAERQEMLKQVAEMVRNKKLSFFFEMHDLDDFSFALKKAQEPFQFRKVVLNLNYPDRLVEHDEKTKKDYEVFEAPLL
jgi:trans-2-enoyl-CoA reductase